MARSYRFPGIRPRQTLGRQLDLTARASFPVVVTVLTMLLTQAPFGIPGQAVLLPAVALSSVWFWSVFHPAAMPPLAVFSIGLLLDLLGYLPLGVGVLTLLLAHGIALQWRGFLTRQGFTMSWLAFQPVALGAAALSWLFVMALTLRFVPLTPALFEAVLTGALYPVLAIPLARAHHAIAGTDEA
jgi:rod shape-determining protein MreD